MYAVIDIETTGGSPKRNKITEISIFIFDGEKITDEFSTLINPECSIPPYITKLTGITNEMVTNAPKFFEIAKEIVEITQDKIFVAHNSSFDYGFVREEFKQLGYTYYRQQLDTIKLSRKLIPARKSYSLGNLCNELGITITDRHRAAGDARATVELLAHLLKVNENNQELVNQIKNISNKGLHPDFDTKAFEQIPEDPGVYYFHNDKLDIIYVGKSKNMQQRIRNHFINNGTKKAIEMRSNIVSISHEITGSELVALLLESDEIKTHKPLYNRAQRRAMQHYGIFTYYNEYGYQCFEIKATRRNNDSPLTCFNNKREATRQLHTIVQEYNLCQKLAGLYKSAGNCFYYGLNECKGACVQKEDVKSYNQRASHAINYFKYKYENFIVLEPGRSVGEKSFVMITNGKYLGFGFIPLDEPVYSPEDFKPYLQCKNDNAEVQRIISTYLRKNKVEKILKF